MSLTRSICGLFKWRQFEPEVIPLAIGWYLRFSLSYRDVEELLAERGIAVDHVTLRQWVQLEGTLFASAIAKKTHLPVDFRIEGVLTLPKNGLSLP